MRNGELKQLERDLGSQERVKLELHAESLREVERRLAGQMSGGGGGACTTPAAPVDNSENLLDAAMHLDLAVQAFACDITRVAAVQFGHHQSTQVSLEAVGTPGDWHNSFLHGDNPRDRLLRLERWLCGRFVDAATKLKQLPAPDGSGNLFDQTLMIWARDMGDAVIHSGADMRFVFAGGAGGYLRRSANGRYVDGRGGHHQRALFNCIEAMGIDDFTGFGDPAAASSDRTPLSSIGS